MGFFDFLKKKSDGGEGTGKTKSTAPPPVDKRVAGPAKVAADKRAQTYDRMEALQQLADLRTPDAAAALMKRFNFSIDPSITDQEEKDVAFQGIVLAGKEVVPHVLDFCRRAEALTWPIKILHELLDGSEYEEKLIELLDRYDTEYVRNVEPKTHLLQALEEVKSEAVREAVATYLDDVNETVRFHAVAATFAQNNPESVPALLKLLEQEESVRVKNKVCEGLIFREWTVPAEQRAATEAALSDTAFALGAGGKIQRGRAY